MENKVKLFNGILELAESNPSLYLAALALVFSFRKTKDTDPSCITGYSGGDYKRAIRALRIIQQAKPDLFEGLDIEVAVALLRRERLHKNTATTV